jgi:hypothetical protein
MGWIGKIPAWITGTIALITTVVAFIVFVKANLYLTITATAVIILLIPFVCSLYFAFSRKESEFGKNIIVWRFPEHRRSAFIIMGLVPAIVLISFIITPSRSFIIASVIGTSTPTPTNAPTVIPTSTDTPLPPFTDTPVPPTPTFTPTNTPTSTPTLACPSYQEGTDSQTITNLIQAEAEAANLVSTNLPESINIITCIFAPDATFLDGASGKSWRGPLQRYQDDLFKTTEFKDVEHFDIQPTGGGIVGDVAWYTSGSRGDYRSTNGGNWQSFFNGSLVSIPATQYGSDHWTFRRNGAGRWVITQLAFNAGHLKFPP